MKPIGQAMMVVVGLLIGLLLVSPPISAQLNRISPSQITCAAGRILAGGTPATCTANPTISGMWGTTQNSGGLAFTGATTRLLSADGGAYFIESNGVIQINSASLSLANGGTNKFAIPSVGTTDGQAQFTNGATTTGIGIDVATDSTLKILNRAFATGTELNGGVPTLGTCTGGSLTSGSHNIAGEVTGNTSGSCAINFGTPNFTNAPFCTLNDETNLVAARISARSASSITITGLTSGDAAQWICIGPIGT